MVVCLQACYIVVLSAVAAERAGVATCFVASCLLACWRLCDRLTSGWALHPFCGPQRGVLRVAVALVA